MNKLKNQLEMKRIVMIVVVSVALSGSLLRYHEVLAIGGAQIKVSGGPAAGEFEGWRVGLSTGDRFILTDSGPGLRFGGSVSSYVLTGDFDNDGKTDFAGWNQDVLGWHVSLSTGDGFDSSIEGGGGFWIQNFGDPAEGYMLTGDFNGDGRTDLATWDQGTNGWKVALSKADAHNSATNRGQGFDQFREDGEPDIWIKNFGPNLHGWVLTGDFDGDGKTDLAGWNDSVGAWHVALATNDGHNPNTPDGGGYYFNPLTSNGKLAFWITGRRFAPGLVLTGDFNGPDKDGRSRTDLAVWYPKKDGWQMALSDGSKFIHSQRVWISDFGESSADTMLTGDFDGDGRTDIAHVFASFDAPSEYRGYQVRVAHSTGDSFDNEASWIRQIGRSALSRVLTGNFNGPDDDGLSRADITAWDYTLPNPPIDLQVVNKTPHTLKVRWQDDSDVEQGFKIFVDDRLIGQMDPQVRGKIVEFPIDNLCASAVYRIDIACYNRAFCARPFHSLSVRMPSSISGGTLRASSVEQTQRITLNKQQPCPVSGRAYYHAELYPNRPLILFKALKFLATSADQTLLLNSDCISNSSTTYKLSSGQSISSWPFNQTPNGTATIAIDALLTQTGATLPETVAIEFTYVVPPGCPPSQPNCFAAAVGEADSCQAVQTILDPLTLRCSNNISIETPIVPVSVNYLPPEVNRSEGVTVSCSPPSNSFFPLGATPITCTATDGSGASASCKFAVVVNVISPPPLALSCVGDLHVVVPPGQPSVVNYPQPVLNKPEGATLDCSPPSGSTFPLGITTVSCTANNAFGETAACTFAVRVKLGKR